MRKTAAVISSAILFACLSGCEVTTDDGEDGANGANGGEKGPPGTRLPSDGGPEAREDAEGRAPSDTAPDASATDASTPSAAPDGSSPAVGSTDVATAVTESKQARAVCDAPLPSASAACAGPDVFEPNDDTPIALGSADGDGCLIVPSKTSGDRDRDSFTFIPSKTDPVRVELAYETPADGAADLEVRLVNAMGQGEYSFGGDRSSTVYGASRTRVLNAGVAYEVELYGGGESCQGYNLRIDPSVCTDAYEDNDEEEAKSQLSLNQMITATAFVHDADWYDALEIGAVGASCVLSAPLTRASPETLSFALKQANGTSVRTIELVGAQGDTEKTLTVEAGSTAAYLHVYSNEYVCTPYTILCTPL